MTMLLHISVSGRLQLARVYPVVVRSTTRSRMRCWNVSRAPSVAPVSSLRHRLQEVQKRCIFITSVGKLICNYLILETNYVLFNKYTRLVCVLVRCLRWRYSHKNTLSDSVHKNFPANSSLIAATFHRSR